MKKDNRPIILGPPANSPIEVPNFAFLGLNEVAYLRPVSSQDMNGYGIFAANGEQIGVAPDRDTAYAATLDNDLIPLSVH